MSETWFAALAAANRRREALREAENARQVRALKKARKAK